MTETTRTPGDRKLRLDRMQLEEAVISRFAVTVEPGTEIEDLLRPVFWGNVAQVRGMKWGDHVTVRAEDRSFIANLLVLDAGPNWAKVMVLNKHNFNVAKPGENFPEVLEGYRIKHAGAAKWRVTRVDDNEVMIDQLASAAKAHQWRAELLERLAVAA